MTEQRFMQSKNQIEQSAKKNQNINFPQPSLGDNFCQMPKKSYDDSSIHINDSEHHRQGRNLNSYPPNTNIQDEFKRPTEQLNENQGNPELPNQIVQNIENKESQSKLSQNLANPEHEQLEEKNRDKSRNVPEQAEQKYSGYNKAQISPNHYQTNQQKQKSIKDDSIPQMEQEHSQEELEHDQPQSSIMESEEEISSSSEGGLLDRKRPKKNKTLFIKKKFVRVTLKLKKIGRKHERYTILNEKRNKKSEQIQNHKPVHYQLRKNPFKNFQNVEDGQKIESSKNTYDVDIFQSRNKKKGKIERDEEEDKKFALTQKAIEEMEDQSVDLKVNLRLSELDEKPIKQKKKKQLALKKHASDEQKQNSSLINHAQESSKEKKNSKEPEKLPEKPEEPKMKAPPHKPQQIIQPQPITEKPQQIKQVEKPNMNQFQSQANFQIPIQQNPQMNYQELYKNLHRNSGEIKQGQGGQNNYNVASWLSYPNGYQNMQMVYPSMATQNAQKMMYGSNQYQLYNPYQMMMNQGNQMPMYYAYQMGQMNPYQYQQGGDKSKKGESDQK